MNNKKKEITRESARRRVYKYMFVNGIQMVVLIVMTFATAFIWSLV